jgi:hypothetical protein
MTVTITPTTDLAPLVGKRVHISQPLPVGGRDGIFESLWHSADLRSPIGEPHCGGMLLEDPHSDCRGGMTGFNLPYDVTTVTVLDG